MKRNEMVELIHRTIIRNKEWDSNSWDMADDILLTIEAEGMLPPAIEVNDPGHFEGDEFDYNVNAWEEDGE